MKLVPVYIRHLTNDTTKNKITSKEEKEKNYKYAVKLFFSSRVVGRIDGVVTDKGRKKISKAKRRLERAMKLIGSQRRRSEKT